MASDEASCEASCEIKKAKVGGRHLTGRLSQRKGGSGNREVPNLKEIMHCYSKRRGTLDFLSLENYSGPSPHPQGPHANSSENLAHLNMSKKRNDQSFCSIDYED